MYDLHSHVLPSVDDGSKNEKMSLEMLRNAFLQGVSLVAATPHCTPKSRDAVDEFLKKRNDAYKRLMSSAGDIKEIPEIVLGAEVYLCKDISDYENLSSLCYENTNYILLELPSDVDASTLYEWVYNIKVKGLRPVIAHVDRYADYREIMAEFESLDVIYQVNSARFLSMFDRSLLKKIFKKHDKFFVSTDMHNLTTRTCNIEKAYKIAEKKFPGMVSMLFNDGAASIVSNSDFLSL